MMREKIGQVNVMEKYEILRLYERIIALKEVSITIDNDDVDEEKKDKLIDKIKKELPMVEKLYSDWWQSKANKYMWIKVDNGRWSIDFNSNDIYLEKVD